jgi:hypothetical protein
MGCDPRVGGRVVLGPLAPAARSPAAHRSGARCRVEAASGRLDDPRVPYRGSTPARPARHLGKPSILTVWNCLPDRAVRRGRSLSCREPGRLPGAAGQAVPACGGRVGRPRRRCPSDAPWDQTGRGAKRGDSSCVTARRVRLRGPSGLAPCIVRFIYRSTGAVAPSTRAASKARPRATSVRESPRISR